MNPVGGFCLRLMGGRFRVGGAAQVDVDVAVEGGPLGFGGDVFEGQFSGGFQFGRAPDYGFAVSDAPAVATGRNQNRQSP